MAFPSHVGSASGKRLGSSRVALHLLLGGALAAVVGCSPPPSTPVRAAPAATAPPQMAPRPPLTADEATLAERLRGHVSELGTTIGERNPEHPWELASAADYVAGQFEALGFPLERQGYEVAGVAAQNIAVTVPGGELGKEIVVVGAHYDSPRGSRGENDNGTGVAAVVELARMLREAKSKRTLRLVAFAVSEPPFAGTDDMGSARYVKHLTEGSEQVVAMINLDRIGTLSEWPGQGPAHLKLGAAAGASPLSGRLQEELAGDPLLIDAVSLDASPSSDQWAFARQGIPAVWLSGAGRSEVVDYDGMTRLVMRLRFALATLLGETPTNDGMLTPDMGLVR